MLFLGQFFGLRKERNQRAFNSVENYVNRIRNSVLHNIFEWIGILDSCKDLSFVEFLDLFSVENSFL